MSNKRKFILGILAILLLVALILTSCTGGIARGWAGGAVSNGDLFVASMKGRIVAIDASNNAILGQPVQISIPASSGLNCLPSSCGGQSSSPLVIYASPAVQGEVVYLGGTGATGGKVYGYQFVNNALLADPEWTYPKTGYLTGSIIGGLTIINDTVYFATSDGIIYALNANGLYFEWSHKIKSKIWSAPVVDGNTLYIGCFDKTVYALNIADGTEKWQYKTDGAINSTPLVYNNTIYIGNYSRHFYALDAATGNLVWKFPNNDAGTGNPQNWFWAKPVVLNGNVYAPCLDGNVYVLDAANGNLVNTIILGDSISSSPVVTGNSIVVTTAVGSYSPTKQRGKVYIINTIDGSHRELDFPAYEDVNAPLFSLNDVVYFHTTKDNLFSIDTSVNGSQLKLIFNLSTVK